jgi:hypothetical protein
MHLLYVACSRNEESRYNGEPNFTKSEYNHCVYGIFIILVLYVVLVPITGMVDINRLAQVVRTFVMKDLGETK